MLRSAGQNFLNFSDLLGYSRAAQLETPESNQTSRTSGTLVKIFPDFVFIFISSIPGLWVSFTFMPDSFSNSSMLPTTILSPVFSSYHIGSGVPQYFCLETGQSLMPSSQAFIRSFIQSGFQVFFSFSSRSFFLIPETFMNHCGCEIIKIGRAH